ncbi:hypothetical protein HZS_7442 [Henneguya salminicola]|nr:hypothetical protein HZS_7442 [Henneguya salminicola]
MIQISTIILILLILSCINYANCVRNISYKFQSYHPPLLDSIHYTELDIESIIQSSRPMFYDISIVLTQNACYFCRSNVANITRYIELLFKYASEQNKVAPSNPLNGTDYENYFSSISPRPDALVVLEDISHPTYIGISNIGKVCSASGIAILDLCRRSEFNPKRAGETLAHELGHILGLNDIKDSDKNCKCGTPGLYFCLMYSSDDQWYGKYPRSFTDCEMKNIKNNLKNYQCLSAKYIAVQSIPNFSQDYMKLVEMEDKKLFSDNECCDQKTCKYKKTQYKCWHGECCKKCTIVKRKVCRNSIAECDNTEFCDGINSECPMDRYKNNFELCKNQQGFCYLKSCINMDVMCRIGYKNKEAYFSIKCAKALGNIMKSKCPTPSKITEFNRVVCSRKVPCEHFVCAIPKGSTALGALHFLGSNRKELCLIPKKNNRHGLTSKASMYMNCGFNRKYPKFCYKTKCSNSSKLLKNCDSYHCKNMNSKSYFQI